MLVSEATKKICPFMSAKLNLSVRNDRGVPDNKPNLFYCCASSCMSWVATKTEIDIWDNEIGCYVSGGVLDYLSCEGFCSLMEFNYA